MLGVWHGSDTQQGLYGSEKLLAQESQVGARRDGGPARGAGGSLARGTAEHSENLRRGLTEEKRKDE